jgi:hypothetical protein
VFISLYCIVLYLYCIVLYYVLYFIVCIIDDVKSSSFLEFVIYSIG